jgi:hypothetical protein
MFIEHKRQAKGKHQNSSWKKNCGITFLSGAIDERGSFRKGEKENKNEAFLNTSRHSFYSFHDKEVLWWYKAFNPQAFPDDNIAQVMILFTCSQHALMISSRLEKMFAVSIEKLLDKNMSAWHSNQDLDDEVKKNSKTPRNCY